jgi:hypothetical protein
MQRKWKPLPKRFKHLSDEEIAYRRYLSTPEPDDSDALWPDTRTEEQKQDQERALRELAEAGRKRRLAAARERRRAPKDTNKLW